ncbi:MAG: hypothetical protein QF465_04840 [SAR202 cluster bacterium]|nr:hypothetical protein [SAR202 cluster bacterium]
MFSGVDEPLGAFEIYQPYAPTADRIASTTNLLYLAALVGFALIYTTSVTLVWYVSRVVRRQQTALTDAYTELAEARNKLESRVDERTADLSAAAADLQTSEETQRAMADEATVLAEIGRTVNSTLKPDDVYELIAKQANKLIRYDRMAIYLVEADPRTLKCTFTKGLDIPNRGKGTVIEVDAFLQEVIRRRAAVVVNPENEGYWTNRFPVIKPEMNSMLLPPTKLIGSRWPTIWHPKRPAASHSGPVASKSCSNPTSEPQRFRCSGSRGATRKCPSCLGCLRGDVSANGLVKKPSNVHTNPPMSSYASDFNHMVESGRSARGGPCL